MLTDGISSLPFDRGEEEEEGDGRTGRQGAQTGQISIRLPVEQRRRVGTVGLAGGLAEPEPSAYRRPITTRLQIRLVRSAKAPRSLAFGLEPRQGRPPLSVRIRWTLVETVATRTRGCTALYAVVTRTPFATCRTPSTPPPRPIPFTPAHDQLAIHGRSQSRPDPATGIALCHCANLCLHVVKAPKPLYPSSPEIGRRPVTSDVSLQIPTPYQPHWY